MSNLKKSLRTAIRRLSFNTSVDQLKRQGIQKVNVLGIDRVAMLIEQAVHKSLRHRLLSAERTQVADATAEEFLKLLKSNEDLRRSRDTLAEEKAKAEEKSTTLRLEIQRLQQDLDARLEQAGTDRRARYEGENAEIYRRIHILFEGVAAGELNEQHIGVLVMDLLDRERHAVVVVEEAQRNREVSLLQRRIAKLNRSLETAERRLESDPGVAETGIASIYREVQGLRVDDREYKRKKKLMTDVFKANLVLQGKA